MNVAAAALARTLRHAARPAGGSPLHMVVAAAEAAGRAIN
eukprot:SAG31_NODE_42926_length_269_cov_0.905882_1_plen_39_part_10